MTAIDNILKFGKIPHSIHQDALDFFTKFAVDKSVATVGLFLYFNVEKNVYFLFCPKQRIINNLMVEFNHPLYQEEISEGIISGNFVLVAEFVSHGKISAFLSETSKEHRISNLIFVYGNLLSEVSQFAAFQIDVDSHDIMEIPKEHLFDDIHQNKIYNSENWFVNITF